MSKQQQTISKEAHIFQGIGIYCPDDVIFHPKSRHSAMCGVELYRLSPGLNSVLCIFHSGPSTLAVNWTCPVPPNAGDLCECYVAKCADVKSIL